MSKASRGCPRPSPSSRRPPRKIPRSTVGTVTEIYDYLRLLFARVGRVHCPSCGKEIASQTVQQMVDRIMAMPEKTPPAAAGAARPRAQRGIPQGAQAAAGRWLRPRAYRRRNVRAGRRDASGQEQEAYHRSGGRPAWWSRRGSRAAWPIRWRRRCASAEGIVRVEVVDGESQLFSEQHACVECGISLPEITPRMFSFNNPYGACPDCAGLGTRMYFDPEQVVPNPAAVAARRGDRSLGEPHRLLLPAAAGGAGGSLPVRSPRTLCQLCRKRCARRCCTARGRRRCGSSSIRAVAGIFTRSPSKG